jgi:hypothetical protein
VPGADLPEFVKPAQSEPWRHPNPLQIGLPKPNSARTLPAIHPNRPELKEITDSIPKCAQLSVLDINGKFAKIKRLKNNIGPKSPFFVCKTDLWI